MNMQDKARVQVRLSGGDDRWYIGTVIKARKMWVELEDYGRPMIADESNILEWRPFLNATEFLVYVRDRLKLDSLNDSQNLLDLEAALDQLEAVIRTSVIAVESLQKVQHAYEVEAMRANRHEKPGDAVAIKR